MIHSNNDTIRLMTDVFLSTDDSIIAENSRIKM